MFYKNTFAHSSYIEIY